MQIKEKHFRLELVMETIMVHMWTKGHGKIVSVSFPVTVVLFFQLERKNIGMENTTLLLLGWIVFFLIYVIYLLLIYFIFYLFIYSFIYNSEWTFWDTLRICPCCNPDEKQYKHNERLTHIYSIFCSEPNVTLC